MQYKNQDNPTPEQLNLEPFRLIEELAHDQIMDFVKQYIKKRNVFVAGCWVSNILVSGWIGSALVLPSELPVLEKLSYFFIGMFLFLLLLLPVHELIHAAVYKWQGATRIIIEAQWRKMVFLALADRFVVNSRQFYVLALAPFVVISCLLVLAAFQAGETFQWIIYGALLFHTSGCIGDFALCSFLYENKHQTVYTYDDYAARKSYFYAETEADAPREI